MLNDKYYKIFVESFLRDFNERYGQSVTNFLEALMYFFNRNKGELPYVEEVIELEGLYDGLTSNEAEIVKKIKRSIETRDGYKKYMSKTIDKITSLDYLKNLHNIYHFHIGEDIGERFVLRSNKILFIYFSDLDRKAYMICVKAHPKGKKWGSPEPVKILYNQYPELFNIVKGKVEPDINEEEQYEEFFKEKINVFLKMDDNVYVQPLNIGFTLFGDSFRNTVYRNKFINKTFRKFRSGIYRNYGFIFAKDELFIEAYLRAPHRKQKEVYVWRNNELILFFC